MSYVIEQELCSACHRCRTGCPVQAIRFKDAKYWIDPDKCISCGQCVKVCHNGCISDPEHPAPKAEPHDKTVLSCDVCVIGGGGSGLVAANKAQDLGKKVVVLEKMHEVGGSSWYAGGFRIHWCKGSQELGVKDERQAKYQEFMQKTDYRVNPKLLARMFQANEEFADWLMDEHRILDDYFLSKGRMGPGPEVVRFEARAPWKDASKRIDRMIGPGEIGSYLAEHLSKELTGKGGTLLLKTAAYQLLTDDSGAISGVLARDEGGEVEVRCKAVVVASGAFSRNKELMDQFQPMFYDNEGKEKIHIFTGAGCTGDGITMCKQLGADIDYTNRRVNMFGPMRHPYPCASMAVYQNQDGFEIGSQGDPFFSPMGIEVSGLTRDPKWHGWKIVDDAICQQAIAEAMEEPPQSQEMDLPKFQAKWREVFAEEALDNAIVTADTIEELADKLGIDRAVLLKDVSDYNERVKNPAPVPDDLPDFMRPKHAPMPVAQAPFYAIKMKMFHENSIGGMTIDENASVLKNGIPIPGLYASGDTTRGIMVSGDIGVDYLELVFSSLTMAYNEGYIAGTEAAKFCS
jgi:fumarate reductase flavoprotein subunit